MNKKRRDDKTVKKCRIAILLAAVMVLAAGCKGTQETLKPEVSLTEAVPSEQQETLQEQPETPSGQPETPSEQPETPSGQSEAPSEQADGQGSEIPVVLENLNADGSFLSRGFYQAGNINSQMYCYVYSGDGDEFLSSHLGISITKMTPYSGDTADDREFIVCAEAVVETIPGQNTYETELAVTCYQDWQPVFEDTYPVTVSLSEKDDPEEAVILEVPDKIQDVELADGKNVTEGIRSLTGAYYGMDSEWDLFTRYLCKAEFCAYPTEVLRLMRNTIYAVHGRGFKDPLLAEYMEGKPWYRRLTEPEDFSEDVLSDVEKKNIALLKELEETPYDQRCRMYGADYSIEGFAEAPYLPLLSQNKETGLYADFSQAEDCGAYYRVPGELSLPITMTRKQWENVQNGGTEEICMNELTGETRLLEMDEEGYYRMYEKETGMEEWSPFDMWTDYQYDTGLYEFQVLSDDTLMKPVYEGDLYFLKGAVWGGMVNLSSASELQEEITMQTKAVYGNCLYHNGRGYFTAVYALGD